MDPQPSPSVIPTPPPQQTPERQAWELLSNLIDAWDVALQVQRSSEQAAARERFQRLHERARHLIAWAIRNGESP